MAWIVQPLERKNDAGQPSGLWHLTASSDEGGGFVVGCDHDHASAEEAQECDAAQTKIGHATGFPRVERGPTTEERLERALASLRALQEGAALAMSTCEENGPVHDFLCAIHREAVKGQLLSDDASDERAA
jgi:hypothetical protein